MQSEVIGRLQHIDWGQVAALLGIAGGVLAFVFWERRKMKFEIEKLRLEIEKLRQEESRIYRPTLAEIRSVLHQTEHISQRTRKMVGSSEPLEDFGVELHRFLNLLLAYFGTAGPPDGQEAEAPDPTATYEFWQRVKSHGVIGLPSNTIEDIDFLLRSLLRWKSARAAGPPPRPPITSADDSAATESFPHKQ